MSDITLAECPIGLFLYQDELCLKTEYGNNEGRIDAFIVSSGEFFWGDPPQTIASQRAQLVIPIEDATTIPRAQYEALMAAASALKRSQINPKLAEPFVLRALAALRAAGILEGE